MEPRATTTVQAGSPPAGSTAAERARSIMERAVERARPEPELNPLSAAASMPADVAALAAQMTAGGALILAFKGLAALPEGIGALAGLRILNLTGSSSRGP